MRSGEKARKIASDQMNQEFRRRDKSKRAIEGRQVKPGCIILPSGSRFCKDFSGKNDASNKLLAAGKSAAKTGENQADFLQ